MNRAYKTGKENPTFKDRTGEKHFTKEGYLVTIIEYFGRHNCTIEFEDGTILKKTHYYNICKGSISNPYHPTVCRTGYFGIGEYSANRGAKNYNTWGDMIRRGYDNKFKEENLSYVDCLVDEGWHNFQNFAKWHKKNYKEGFELDKDILVKGNKIYSPETCCFVPKDINNLFIKRIKSSGNLPLGVVKNGKRYQARVSVNGEVLSFCLFDTPEEAFQSYKAEKEKHIKEMADKWRGQITEECYEAMYNYQVEITD